MTVLLFYFSSFIIILCVIKWEYNKIYEAAEICMR